MTSLSSATQQLQHFLTVLPPNVTNIDPNNRIAVAHAALEYLRQSGDADWLFLRCLVEFQTRDEELLFHCITGCRQVLLWKYQRSCSSPLMTVLRGSFISMAEQKFQFSRTLQLACLNTSVVLWKRAWKDDAAAAIDIAMSAVQNPMEQALLQQITANLQLPPLLSTPDDLLNYLQQHWFQVNPTLAALFCSQLIGEMSGKSAVSYRLPLEFHQKVHSIFEKKHLLQCLNMALKALEQVVSQVLNNNQSTALTLPEQTLAVVQLVIDILTWEFGLAAWSTSSFGALASLTRTLLRPPIEWKEHLARPELVRAVFETHARVMAAQSESSPLAMLLRQLILQLASLAGPMFVQADDIKRQYAECLLQGSLQLLQSPGVMLPESALLPDTLGIISRIVFNFRLATLMELQLQPTLVSLLQGLASIGMTVLHDQLLDCQQAQGDIDGMQFYDWREGIISIVVECGVTLCGDPWLLYTGTDESRQHACESLSQVLGPLYEAFVSCRTKMAAIEEHYQVTHEEDLDELKEDILEGSMDEELTAVSSMGRLNLSLALACLSARFGETMPKLQAFWEGTGNVSAEIAALLEEARMLSMFACHLLTDENKGEKAAIPDAIVIAADRYPNLTIEIAGAVNAMVQFADAQAKKIASNPNNLRLSPMLSRSFLWFFRRWAPAYVYPSDGESSRNSLLLQNWSNSESAQQIISFCVDLCLQYQCFWPQEKILQASASSLLQSFADKTGPVRQALVASPSFQQLVRFHCLTGDMRHFASHAEFDAIIKTKLGQDQLHLLNLVWGYQRLPYNDKAGILTVILVACSDTTDNTANAMITESMKVVHDGFTSLVNALAAKQFGPDDLDAKEMASLCIEMFCGIAHASQMTDAERVPQFLTPFLPQLTGLVTFYSTDLSVSENVLRFFRDYTEQFIVMLNRDQCLALFAAVAEALKSYSANHIQHRVIKRKASTEATADEEQAYSDILCVLQLLVNLGTKDFIDACSSAEGVDSAQVTDMVFYGLEKILPLMSEGLLQFPSLCTTFFELVFYMMDTYPEKVCSLPYEVFHALMESILFGMKYQDAHVAKCSLHSLASIPRECLKNPQLIAPHLAQHPDIFSNCTKRLLTEVVFQNVVVDRIEPAGLAFLFLVAVDVNGFGTLMQGLVNQVADEQQRIRLQSAFCKLVQPDMVKRAGEGGYEGRMVRSRFKTLFEEFVNEVHSFLLLR
ncbi:hypothetical protein MPSEU_000114700 [Mayamaea pseudoterrestris]|nr:hypothetical protein MPSEU_000114700 [Mayamaea pseudoterrestris]